MQMNHSCRAAEIRTSLPPPVDQSTSMSLHWLRFPRNQIQKSLRSATNPSDATPGTNAHKIPPLESYGNQSRNWNWNRNRERSLITTSLQVDVSISCGRFQVSLVRETKKWSQNENPFHFLRQFLSGDQRIFGKLCGKMLLLQCSRAFSITTEAVSFDLSPLHITMELGPIKKKRLICVNI